MRKNNEMHKFYFSDLLNVLYLISCNIHEMAAQNICPFPFSLFIWLFVQKGDGAYSTRRVHLCDAVGSWDDVKWNRLLADVIECGLITQ